jgi:3-mercaptopyruvate sulfurtransferase SseA
MAAIRCRTAMPSPRSSGQWGIGPDTQVVVYDGSDGSMAASRLWWLLR